jgi:GNAT superfamily N-acetyltransferase
MHGANARIDEGGEMAHPERLRFRTAGAADAIAVAALHAESWRRHYRGAYSDSFLDGDVVADREMIWTERLRTADGGSYTVLAEADAGIVGFAHAVFDSDPTWGALVDNLHVRQQHKRRGVGSELLALIAQAAIEREKPLYLWVLEQNFDARAFYEARSAVRVERALVSAPGGVKSRLNRTPSKLRYAWSDPTVVLTYRSPIAGDANMSGAIVEGSGLSSD